MQYLAHSTDIKISPRKVRLVAEGIKKQSIPSAISHLSISGKRAAGPVKKTIESAIANAVNNFKAVKEKLYIADIWVNEGTSYKRFHFAARGRTRPYKKRASKITVILDDGGK